MPFGTKCLDAALCFPASVKDVHTAVILTHGAGGDMNFKHLVSLAHALASGGFICLRFTCKALNLGYRVKAYRAVWVSIFIHSRKSSHFSTHTIVCMCYYTYFILFRINKMLCTLVFPTQDYLKSLQKFTIKHIFVGGKHR